MYTVCDPNININALIVVHLNSFPYTVFIALICTYAGKFVNLMNCLLTKFYIIIMYLPAGSISFSKLFLAKLT